MEILTVFSVIFGGICAIGTVLTCIDSKRKKSKNSSNNTMTTHVKTVINLGWIHIAITKHFNCKNEEKGDENMFNLNFDKNKKKLQEEQNTPPEYVGKNFSSDEYFIGVLKTIEEKKRENDKIDY